MNSQLISPPAGPPLAETGQELTCTVLSDPAAVEGLRADWLDLLGRSDAAQAMLTPVWLLAWWKVYGEGTGRALRVGLFREGGRLVGLAPLTARRFWHRPGIPFRRLEPLGANVDEGDGVCSDYLNVIAERGAEARVARALARQLQAGGFGPWDELVLPALDGEGVMPALLAEALRGEGLRVTSTHYDDAPYIPLPASWDDYLKALPRKKRYDLGRGLRHFESWAAGEWEVRRVRTAAELAEGKRVLSQLHGQRWQGAGHAGVFAAPRFAAFHDLVMLRFLEEGALELAWLVVRGEPVAVVYNFLWNGKVSFYQCGRRLDVPENTRPGIALLAHLIRGAIEAGRREFDFLAGAAYYKTQLALAMRPLVEVRAARPSLRERLRCAAERGIGWARSVRGAARSAVGWLRGSPAREAAPAPEPAER